MTLQGHPPSTPARKPGFLTRLALSPGFHRFASAMPGLRRIARQEGEALFSVLSGFVQSQVLMALVEGEVLHHLAEGPLSTDDLALRVLISPDRLQILLQAGAGLKLLHRKAGLWALTPRGAAFLAVPGLEAMVRHHHVLYDDLRAPLAFFRGETETGLAQFWPYVFGGLAQEDAALAARYSNLMSDSQKLVAQDTMRLVDLSEAVHLMDVGGGTGAFLAEVGHAFPALRMSLFDLPDVLAGAPARLGDMAARVQLHPGSFRTDSLPRGADTISLVRVLYDHPDSVVLPLLRAVHAALPPKGRIVISEPMSGGKRPDPATDVYFAVYTLAMRTGRTRSAPEICELLNKAGFCAPVSRRGYRPFVTSAVVATRG